MSLLDLHRIESIPSGNRLGKLIREEYLAAWNTLKWEHRNGMNSLEVVSQLTRLMDELIDFVYRRAARDAEKKGLKPDNRLVLMALGSYGRRELAPHSDIDLIFLLPEKVTDWSKEFTEMVLYTLWDTGLDVGYSTRSMSDCMALAPENHDVLTSLLDARYLQGNLDLFSNFRKEFRRRVLNKTGSQFVTAKLELMKERLIKHGGTIYVLEPNLKEGMGGLRDLHTAMWVAKVLFGADDLEKLCNIKELNVLDEKDLQILKSSFDFLMKVRCELHFASNAARDLLSMERQPYLAERFGIKDRRGVPAVEKFMQTYYSHTGQVHHITGSIIRRSLERKKRSPRILARWKEKDLGRGFFSRGGEIHTRVDPVELFKRYPGRMLRAFRLFQESNLELSPEVAVAVRRSLKLVNNDYRKRKRGRDAFFRIMSDDRRLYETLLLMNELGFLRKYIPEFAPIFCKMQHDYYHTYTVDEHSIRAIREIVDLPLASDSSLELYQEVYREIKTNRLLLFLTILLHDVGKGSGANHAEKGAAMAMRAAKRLGMSREDIDDMGFLIENHLLLSHVAQRRDLHEERTIWEVANLMGNPRRLKLLFLLTMADLKAVGPGVWNEWKASLLAELFLEAIRAIDRGGIFREDLPKRIEKTRTKVAKTLADEFDPQLVQAELDALSERAYGVYRSRVLGQFITLHLKIGDRPVATSWRQARRGGYTELFVVAQDQPGLFSRIAGVLAANNVNILGAQLLTRDDGVVFDILYVTDNVMKPISDRMKFRMVNRELAKVIGGDLDVDDLLKARRLSLPLDRRDRATMPAPTRVDIHNSVSDAFTVIDIYTTDRIGLLYTITSTLAASNLSIHTAKVSTKVDQAVDVFYVTDLNGGKILDETKIEAVRKTLMQALTDDA
ncbi:MAG: [protein-PII] uridylyltransferase [Deltaproteobacteria bacterium]|nr:[protein-PII] uridylyltransferase [Deltaproteobacteria bacterium]